MMLLEVILYLIIILFFHIFVQSCECFSCVVQEQGQIHVYL